VACLQSLSGTGSLRVAAGFIARFMKGSTVYLSNPTWGNHRNIFGDEGVEWKYYRCGARGVPLMPAWWCCSAVEGCHGVWNEGVTVYRCSTRGLPACLPACLPAGCSVLPLEPTNAVRAALRCAVTPLRAAAAVVKHCCGCRYAAWAQQRCTPGAGLSPQTCLCMQHCCACLTPYAACLTPYAACLTPARYFDPETVGLDFTGMSEDLKAAPEGSVVVLHGGCLGQC
jgi:hypothetical protein